MGSANRVPTTDLMDGPLGATAWAVGVTAHAASPPAQTRKTVVARTTVGAQGTGHSLACGAAIGCHPMPPDPNRRGGSRDFSPDDTYVLAVDLGTGGPKVALVSATGRIAASGKPPRR